MSDIVRTLYNIVQYMLGSSPMVMLSLVLFTLALFSKAKPTKALHSSLMVGVGFIGTYAIFDVLISNVGPVAQAMVERTGINLLMADLGWPPLSAITWGSPIAPFIIPLTILINVAVLALNKTYIVGVDMWNYWHFALVDMLVYYSTGSLFFGSLTAVIAAVVVLKLANWSAPLIQKYSGLEGISLPTLSSVVFFPVGLLVDRIIDHIPDLDRIHIDPETVQKKSGILGKPMMVGTILDTLLGVVAGYDFKKVLLLDISTGGVMFVLSRMVHILMEGLLSLSETIKKYLNAKYPDRNDFYTGLDIAVAVGNPVIISIALLLTPISVLIALVLPGNEVLLLSDLANLAVMALMIALASRGNIFRTVLAAIPVIITDLWTVIKIASLTTGMAKNTNFKFAEGSSGQVSGFPNGSNLFRFWLLEILNGSIIAIGLVPVIALVPYGIFRMTRSTVYV